MAERRMITKKVTDDDNFMSLSSSAQALYLHLNMAADDDGFNNQVTVSMFKAHASVDDLKALLEKRYIYQFENGVIVIKHWRMANALRKDRYTPTAFKEEMKQLGIKDNGSYTFTGNQTATNWQPNGNQTATQDSIGKDSIGKDNSVGAKTKRFAPPTLEELDAYCEKKGYSFNTKRFISYYESNGWKVGRNKMRSWRATADRWAMGTEKEQPKPKGYNSDNVKEEPKKKERSYSQDEFERLLGISEE